MDLVLPFIYSHWISLAATLSIAYLLGRYFNHGLNKYPGPALAKFTDLWRFWDVKKGNSEKTHIRLHRELGDVVRLGPNCLSFSDPRAIKAIYGLKKGYIKSNFYPVQAAMLRGKRLPSLFATLDEGYHAQFRRSVNAAFSMNSLMELEPLVSEVVELFLNRTDELFAATDKSCDFARWLQYFAFDVVGQITYSKRHGFIEENRDIDGIISFLAQLFSYVAPIGQMPWLDLILLKNPIIRLLDYAGVKVAQFPVTKFARARVLERRAELQADKRTAQQTGYTDLLSKFLIAQQNHPDFMTDLRVLTMSVGISFAGSDTTAISLSSVFYFLLKHPASLEKVLHEIRTARQDGRIKDRESKLVNWAEALTLPYLDACIKEAFRLYPAAGLLLERIVPAGGAEIAGHFVQGGTIVGCNAWVIHRNEAVFGADVDSYIPERWLDVSPEKKKEMDGTMFQFGAGVRTCIGKNISLLEIYKLVPSFLSRFEIEFADPTRDWKTHNAWFVRQDNFITKFKAKQDV